MASPANIRVSAQFPFPALVVGGAPVTVTKANGIWTIGLNLAGLGIATPPLASYPTDYVLVYDGVAQTTFRMPISALAIPGAPQGRLTLTSGTAVPTASVSAAGTLFYTPAIGQFVPLWSGTQFIMVNTGGEISQLATDATKSPAAVGNNLNYDIFVWSDAGTMRATRGPDWTQGGGSATVRGAGAGSTQLQIVQGIAVNQFDIVNGPKAGFGTYVGSVRSNGTATFDMNFGSIAAGGGMATLGVWNAFNRVLMQAKVIDNTASWTYNAVAVRAANNSATARVNFITGLATDAIAAKYAIQITTAAVLGSGATFGYGVDGTVYGTLGQKGQIVTNANLAQIGDVPAADIVAPQLGFHFISAVESSLDTNVQTFTGGGGPSHSLTVSIWA